MNSAKKEGKIVTKSVTSSLTNSLGNSVSDELSGWCRATVIDVLEFACAEQGGSVAFQLQQGLLASAGDTTAVIDVLAIEQGVVSILVGIAQEKGFLEVCDHLNHHLVPEWTQLSPWDEAKLSIETVLTMTTGMDDTLSLNGEINNSWRVNHVAHGYLKTLLETTTGQSLAALSHAWLFEPLGMIGTRWFDRQQTLPDGVMISGLRTRVSDLVKLGQMLLQRGQFAGRSVLGEAYYLDDMLHPGSKENPSWGWLWWNNNQSHFVLPDTIEVCVKESALKASGAIDGVPVPNAPADLYTTRSCNGSFLSVVPSLDITVALITSDSIGVRQSLAFENEFWRRLLAAKI
ncbi:MAG: CubicO group peptidase (beta-lactamase class C family) [Candidatus Pseudothioglobus sp.]